VLINEWMAANTSTLVNPASGKFDDWFELYNPNSVSMDLSGYWLADNLTNSSARWPVPTRTTIAPHNFLLVWADGGTVQGPGAANDLHAAFKLNKDGEAIGLFAPNGTLIDSVVYGAQSKDISQGRWPDGSTNISMALMPTPGGANIDQGASPALEILQAGLALNGLVITWRAEPGQTYTVQSRDALDSNGWTDVAEVAASGPVASTLVTVQAAAHRFYRVQLIRAQ
jgi:hypothetical protein